jgi:cell wall-associated NlpC family hydrolase
LSPQEIYQICLEAGFSPDDAVTWTAIAMAESGGNPAAHNPSGEDSWGLWQINVNPAVRENHWGDLTDPRVNARAAFELSSGGEHMSPWTVTHDSNRGTNHDYRNFLDDASAASGGEYHGDARGVTGYGGGPSTPGTDPDGVAFGGLGDDGADDGTQAALQTFLDSARAQAGDPYVWASEADADDDDPDAFDCSELVQWSASRAGIDMPDGSWLQYLHLQEQGQEMTVEEALHTPGALLFSFSSEPTAGSGRPSSAHVAISLGDGTTIEARGRRWGVGEWEAGDRFTHAGVIPGLATTLAPELPEVPLPPVDTDTDDDLLDDALEMSLGTDPAMADTDGDGLLDGFESAIGTDALQTDTDHDGLSDAYELSRSHTNPLAADTDGDTVSDGLEIAAGTDAVEGAQFTLGNGATPGAFGLGVEADTDNDGLSDAREVALGSNAADADSDHDGLIDGLEFTAGTDLLRADTDSDGLSDAFELSFGTDPTSADTDRDGLFDGAEFAAGTDPGQSSFAPGPQPAGAGGGVALAEAPTTTATAEYDSVVGSEADATGTSGISVLDDDDFATPAGPADDDDGDDDFEI